MSGKRTLDPFCRVEEKNFAFFASSREIFFCEFVTLQLEKYFGAMPDVLLVVVFGSAAEDRLKPDSDVDVGVLASARLSAERKRQWIEDLAQTLGRPIDLIDLSQAHGLLLRRLLTTGRLIVCRDRQPYAALISRMLFEQADFQPYIDRILAQRRKRWIGV